MAVIGIDLGNLSFLISAAGRGGVDVILNGNSNRQNPSMVSIQDKQRFMGEDAAPLARSNYKNTIFGVKRLIGRRWDEPEVQEEIQGLPFQVRQKPVVDPTSRTGDIVYIINYAGEEKEFTPEQIVVMMFSKVQEIVHSACGKFAVEAVVGIPAWFTESQRKAILDAGHIANLPILRLMHETTATALSYGIFKSVKDVFDATRPTNVMFIDMGHSSFTASVVSFVKGSLRVRSCCYDRMLGGRNYDKIIIDMMAEEFMTKYKEEDPRKSPKAYLKLESAAEKAKKTLSPAGVLEARANIECLQNDRDFNFNLKLDAFEAAAQPLLDRMSPVILQAIEEAGIPSTDIESFEIVGGGSRVNCVKVRLSEILKLDSTKMNYGLSTTMNADEAVARGCGLQCAILSTRFSVKPFKIIDVLPFPVKFKWEKQGDGTTEEDKMEVETGEEKDKDDMDLDDTANQALVFKRGEEFPSAKRLTFFRNGDFTVEAEYDEESSSQAYLAPGTNSSLGNFEVKVGDYKAKAVSEEKTSVEQKEKVRLNVMMNINGLVTVRDAHLLELIKEAPPAPVPAPAPAPAPTTNEDTKIGEDSPTTEDEGKGGEGDGSNSKEEAPKEEEEKPKETDKKSGEEEPEKERTPTDSTEAPPAPAKKRFKKIGVNVMRNIHSLTSEDLNGYTELELNMAQQDRIIKETSDMRNALESYCYEMRDKISDYGDYKDFASEAEKTKINADLEETENWLYYGDGFDCTKTVYETKLNSLLVDGNKVRFRFEEVAKRSNEEERCKKLINDFKSKLQSNDEKFAHISDEEKLKAKGEVDSCETWLYDMINQQSALNPSEDPILTSAAIYDRMSVMTKGYAAIMNKPKPPPPPPPTPDESKTNTEGGSTEDAGKDEEKEGDGKEGETKPEEGGEGGEEGGKGKENMQEENEKTGEKESESMDVDKGVGEVETSDKMETEN